MQAALQRAATGPPRAYPRHSERAVEAIPRAQVHVAQHAAQQAAAMGPPQPQPPPVQAHAAQPGQQRSGALMPFNFLLMPEMASLQDGARPRRFTVCLYNNPKFNVYSPVSRAPVTSAVTRRAACMRVWLSALVHPRRPRRWPRVRRF